MDIAPNTWKTISIIDVAFFSAFLVAAAYPLFHIGRVAFFRFTRILLLFTLLLLTKVVSGALMVYALSHTSVFNTGKGIGMTIASSVLASLAPGFLMMSSFKLVQYINHLSRRDHKRANFTMLFETLHKLTVRGERLEAVENLYWYLIIITIALSSAGNGIINSDFSTARSLIRAASVLYLLEWVLLVGLWAYAARSLAGHGASKFKKYSAFILVFVGVAILFMGVRVIAYVCTAFTLEVSQYGFGQSRFSYLFGQWRLYAFISLMPEIIASAIWVLILWCLSMHLRYEVEDDRGRFDGQKRELLNEEEA